MMSSNNLNTGRTKGLQGLLKKTPSDVLKKLHVSVMRDNITPQGSPGPIERAIDDPELIRLSVNYRKDGEPIFGRNNIVVNQDERLVAETRRSRSLGHLKSPASCRKKRNRSSSSKKRSHSPRRRSSDRTDRRSRSPDTRKSVNRIRHGRSSGEEITRKSEERQRRRSFDRYEDMNCTTDRNDSDYRKKSTSPLRPGEYIPFQPDLSKRTTLREDSGKTRYSRRSTSSSRDRYKSSTSTQRTSPRDHESSFRRSSRSRTPKIPSVSPSRGRRKSRSPVTYSGRDRSNEESRSPSSLRQGEKRSSRSPRAK